MKITIYKSISQLATPLGTEAIHGSEMQKIAKIEDAAIVVEGQEIKDVGNSREILDKYKDIADKIIDLSGHAVIPGIVDSHTHFVFGGYRPDEFMMRLKGASYLEIHKMGGGIQSSVVATRKETRENLYKLAEKRLSDFLSMGVTTVEGKSGYGLDEACEIRQLEVLKELNDRHCMTIVPTYLGAHSIPLEYKNRADDYISYMVDKMLPQIKQRGLAEYVDIFCEEGVFNINQARRLLTSAKEMGFKVKIHADEIESTGASELAAEMGATSADHLLMISENGMKKIAESNTVATLLPCTAFCLNKPYAPARRMIDAGCAVALASDFNPGSCFTNSIPLLFALAAIHMNMTLEEVICALTLNGAAAINRAGEIGSVEKGKKADFVVLDYSQIDFLVYHTCKNIVNSVYKNGELVFEKNIFSKREA